MDFLSLFQIIFSLINLCSSTNYHLYPFGIDNGDQLLPNGDDILFKVDLTNTKFPFNGKYEDEIFISVNGYVTFDQNQQDQQQLLFSSACNGDDDKKKDIIAPFLADVNTGDNFGGNIWFRLVVNDYQLRARFLSDFSALDDKVEIDKNCDFTFLVITWENVTHFDKFCSRETLPRNTFQIVLSKVGSDRSFVVINHGNIEWTQWNKFGCLQSGSCGKNEGLMETAFIGFSNGSKLINVGPSCDSSKMVKVFKEDPEISAYQIYKESKLYTKIGNALARIDGLGDVTTTERTSSSSSTSTSTSTVSTTESSTSITTTPEITVPTTTNPWGNCWCCSSPTTSLNRDLPRTVCQ